MKGKGINGKVKLTPEGGIAILLTNLTGSTIVKGSVVAVDSNNDNGITNVPIDIPIPIGVAYDDILTGTSGWVVVSGIAQVLFVNNATRGYLARNCQTGDAGSAVGRGFSEAAPTSPFATDKHFMEFGHVLQSTTAGQLTNVCLHFN